MPHHIKMQFVYILVSLIPLVVLSTKGRLRDTAQFPALRRYAWTAVIVTIALAIIDLAPYLLLRFEWPLWFWATKNFVLGFSWIWLLFGCERLRSRS